uniref:Lysergyl peptide synthetase subunit 3 n=1 Tax=Claviceps paspali TaxID=40601 RepID=G8GV83_CLAPA|nr:lysergyl peptide synthetase subunit 3 [Claviceps paspali]
MGSVRVNLDGISTFLHEHVTAGGISPAAVLLAAWGIVLRTYLHADDVSFEYRQPRCGTTQEESDHSDDVRLCSLSLDGSMTTNDVVRRAELVLNDARSVQDGREHETCRGTKTQHSTLNNTCMVFSADIRLPSHEAGRSGDEGFDAAKYLADHDMVVYVASERLCILSYDSHRFADDQAAHVGATLETVVKSLADAPQQQLIREVQTFSQLDSDKLSKWNATPPVASDVCLQYLVQRQCDLRPDSPAVIAWDGSFTYRQLDILSSSLAERLRAAGVGPDVFVTICAARCRWVPVAMLGIAKAGGAFCALDLSHPLDRLREMRDALKSTITVTTCAESKRASQLASTVSASAAAAAAAVVVVVDERAQVESGEAGQQKRPRPSVAKGHPGNALYAVFTSGSSGKPKGVVIEHRSFSSAALASAQPLDMRPDDRVLHFAAYAFDISIMEVLTPLVLGASVVIPSEKSRRQSLGSAVRELGGVTWASLTPTVARMYHPDEFPSLRTLSLIGEPLQAPDIVLWRAKNLINGYNPAECCPLGISGPVRLSEVSSLGQSFASQASWVVDPLDPNRLMPIGAIGELLIEGPVVARGYVHELSRALPEPESPFVPTLPAWLIRFRRRPVPENTRMYRTGDLVRCAHDASIHYVGRKDSQVKIRGQRVEVGEIESQLHSAVSNDKIRVAVVALQLRGSSKIIAFVSSHSKGLGDDDEAVGQMQVEETTRELDMCIGDATAKLQSILPAYMIPSAVLQVSYLPVSRSGKIDRRGLISFALSLPHEMLLRASNGPETAGDAPQSDDERRLRRIFSLVLDMPLDKIGLESDFFRLGGDSLQAMKLLALAAEAGLSGLSYEDVFRHPRLRDMAKASCESDGDSRNGARILPFSLVADVASLVDMATAQCGVREEVIEDIYPCTPTQVSIMELATTGRAAESFSTSVFALEDRVDAARVKEAWRAVHRANPLLRTRIICSPAGALYQVVVKEEEDLFSDDHDGGDGCGSAEADRDSGRRVGFGAPLVYVNSTKLKGRLVVAIHDVLYDTWSFSQLVNQVSHAYDGLSPPPPPRPHFNYYVACIAASLEAAPSFWRAELDDSNPAQFPAPALRKHRPSTRASLGVRVLTNQEGHDGSALWELQLAWAMTTYARTKNTDVVFGFVSSGRNASWQGAEETIGPMSTLTPLRVTIDDTRDVEEVLEELRYRAEEQSAYSHVGLRRISQSGPGAAAACQFQTVLAVERDLCQTQGAWFSHHVPPQHNAASASCLLALKCVVRPHNVDVFAMFNQQDLPGPEAEHILLQFGYIYTQIHGKQSSIIADINTADFHGCNKVRTLSMPASENRGGMNLNDTDDVPSGRGMNQGKAETETAMCAFRDSLHEAVMVARKQEQRPDKSREGGVDLVSEINWYDDAIKRPRPAEESNPLSAPGARRVGPEDVDARTVFLTGASGFIGTHILRQCLEDEKISRVIALVRGDSVEEARRRVEESARRAQWWSDGHCRKKLHVWRGDLSLPQLGLGPAQWNLLGDGRTVDVIIHNGASVHWLKSYEDLKATNIGATAQLLQLAVENPRLKFVYVSSGRYKDPEAEVEEQTAADIAATPIPYSQTKFVAEFLVRRAAARTPRGHSNVAVVSLGLVVGDSAAGVVNADDYLWRLVATCVKAGVYNMDAADEWTPISDVASAARTIVQTALDPAQAVPPTVTPVTGGLAWREIWDMVSEMGYDVEPRPESAWIATVRRDIETQQEEHPLWTLSHRVESRLEKTGPAWADCWRGGDETAASRLRLAFRRSLEFLCQVGYLPRPAREMEKAHCVAVKNASAFVRSW